MGDREGGREGWVVEGAARRAERREGVERRVWRSDFLGSVQFDWDSGFIGRRRRRTMYS